MVESKSYMMKESNRTRFVCLLLIWGLLDLLSAMFSEIHADEAYYRLYGQFLDWGYFDHPPMVALMTALSNLLVSGSSLIAKNLGVRIVTVLLHLATVSVVWLTLPDEYRKEHNAPLIFMLIAASMVMFSAYGFITAPDSPLLFFAALFYFSYRKYLDKPSWQYALLFGLSIAGMIYSKYMGVLVVGIVILSNIRLLADKRIWAVLLMALLLVMPHLWWQYANGFPSVTYHTVGRATQYSILYTLEYLPNQLVVFNPLLWVLMMWIGFRQLRAEDAFRRSLGWTIWGFQLFFLVMTVRGHVEPHWTMVASVPAVLLVAEQWMASPDFSPFRFKWVRVTQYVMFGLVIVARIVLMLNVLPVRTGLAGKQPEYAAINEMAQGLPVVFDGSFQRTSLYRFYYNDSAVLVPVHPRDRYTQYDLLRLEKELIGKPACIIRFDGKGKNMTVNGYCFPVRFTNCLTYDELE